MTRLARLGAFILLTMGILAVGVFIIGSKEYLFRSTYQLNAQFDDVAGLASGADVQVGGVHSGTVRSITLPHKLGDKIVVVMDMDSITHEIVKKDSIASIETAGVLGNQFMAITFGTAGHEDVRDGETIISEAPLAMADLLKQTTGILNNSQQAIQNITLATGHLNSVSAKIDSGQGTVGSLVNDRQLYIDIERTTASMQETMAQAQIGVISFKENMEALKHNFLLRGYFKKRGYEDSAEIELNRIEQVPTGILLKSFNYPPAQLFDGHESAKLINQNTLEVAGEYLEHHLHGLAVVVVTAGIEGDSQKEMTLSNARAMVVRDYLVSKYEFDDRQMKTLGLGKKVSAIDEQGKESEWGTVQILIYQDSSVSPITAVDPFERPAEKAIGPASKVNGANKLNP